MIRTFATHAIRRTQELSGSGWTFTPLSGGNAGQSYPVVVPCCWETLPGFTSYRGEGDFERDFEAEGDVRLVFEGVSHTGHVYVDGAFLGEHYNAFTPFSCIARGLKAGTHHLKVTVDNRFSEKSALHVPNDYMTYGGISRGVALEEIDGAYIDFVHAVPEKTQDGWKLQVDVKVCSLEPGGDFELMVQMPEAGSVSTEVTTGEDGSAIAHVSLDAANVTEWAPEHPALYFVQAVLVKDGAAVDDLIERTGFREIRTEGKNILLNGRKLRIKGFCRHEDHPLFGCALPLAVLQGDLAIIKDLGGNAVRTTHYPNDERFLDLCDEQGVLVWEENHARGLSEEQMKNPNFEPQEEKVTREMVDAHVSHPCILIWGIMNECASDTEYGRGCYEKQYEILRQMDPSRPVSSASCKFFKDICLDLPDIVSYNLYPEWYVQDKTAAEWVKENYDWVQKETKGAGKPFLITEIGAGGIYGFRSQSMDPWTEDYQAETLDHQLKAVFGTEGISGVFIWQFADVRVSKEWFFSRPRTMNNKGIVDEYRRRKLAYSTVKKIYTSLGNYFED